MKFFHISDLHLGRSLNGWDLADPQRFMLAQIVEKARQFRPDAIVIAGDVYDKAVPSADAFAMLDEFLCDLGGIDPVIPVMIIAGNHDSAVRLNFASSFLERHQIYISVMPPRTA
jgi:exonuclease SbcD